MKLQLCLALLSALTLYGTGMASSSAETSWRDLKEPQKLACGASYYTYFLGKESHVHVIVADLRKLKVRPAMGAATAPTSRLTQDNKACAGINGGYFNLSDGESASYVVIDGKMLADPHDNQALVTNPRLKPFLDTIYRRSEIRFLKNAKNMPEIEIATHDSLLKAGYTLTDSLQAGPQLLPVCRAKEEAFIRLQQDGKEADSIGCRKAAARSAFGITGDGYALFVAVAGKGQEDGTSGLTIFQMADLMKKLGCQQAINLDGGASTTMFVRFCSDKKRLTSSPDSASVVCGKNPETRVKTVLLLENRHD
ncbi:MAG: phosphodiester glycosidase family protein [Candidatus Obscuribacterales bacterium]|nr:phosphodiester glycosidase family protein [Candidatus Obscuribacterales bacterium]